MTRPGPADLAEIPVIDAGRRGALGLYEAAPDAAQRLIASALGTHPLLGLAARLGEGVSRRWLERRDNPYAGEIAAIAAAIGRPGVHLLNIVYEWACSTSAACDPTGPGNRLLRVLDWGLHGIGGFVVIGCHETDHGPYYNVTWPGYAGVLTAMAPGRFAAAINQAPRQAPTGMRWLDEASTRLAMLRAPGTLPAAHLLRRVFEEAADYEGALARLANPAIAVAMPALFTLSGIAPEEGCVVEAIGRRRVVHRAASAPDGVVGVANAWLSPALPGEPRDFARRWSKATTAAASNDERRAMICALQRRAFTGAADLAPPVLNGRTVTVVAANACRGSLAVEALDGATDDPDGLPHPVARAALATAPPLSIEVDGRI